MKIYNPICYSLHTDNVESEKCLKRRFSAWDIVNGTDLDIFVCAEYFRLLYDKYRQNESVWYDRACEDAISEAISEYVPYWDKFKYPHYKSVLNYKHSFVNIYIPYFLLERPKTYKSIHIRDAFQIILDNPTKCKELKASVANKLIEWCSKDTLIKDSKAVQLIRSAFQIEGSSTKGKYYSCHIYSGSEVNENDFIELIIHLTNKLK